MSELAKKTGLDVPTIMEEFAIIKGDEKRPVEAFLSAVETLSKLNKDPEFYNLAVRAIRELNKAMLVKTVTKPKKKLGIVFPCIPPVR